MRNRSEDPLHSKRTLYHGATSRSSFSFLWFFDTEHYLQQTQESLKAIINFNERISAVYTYRSVLANRIIESNGRKEMFYLTTHSTHFVHGYMGLDIW